MANFFSNLNKDGESGFSIRDYVKMSIRMVPNIVVIGEVRDKASKASPLRSNGESAVCPSR